MSQTHTDSKSICVYCGSSSHAHDDYKAAANDLGVLCAERNWTLVYGGAKIGLMGLVADAALSKGGKVIGVIPEFLVDYEVAHQKLTQLHITKTMQERQKKMADLSDICLMLPGGLGTMAEFFEILTWKQLGLHDKPIVVLNVNGYWDSLLFMMEQACEEKFIKAKHNNLIKVVEHVKEVFV